MEYIIQERLAEAKRLRRSLLVTVADVCYRAGFPNTSYSPKLFKQYQGVTPDLYKRPYCAGVARKAARMALRLASVLLPRPAARSQHDNLPA
ncbi:AraC-like DNA-binding protein [Hymenobacter luteus]|uniref:AraC-like DNA-binding protein n=2 Tax=Hymenobacter TaxID=89966 RepID=A0A7W9T2V1_9BACT|nr:MULTISPECIES: AraC family transcriptional regulator [Hymenobacter]MBB4602584.1 AraC-like DNA-binding protein [Hymenobacter latericoloratus]MBB6060475.1 AraC-like DNA-binding protein [Hymenobacter luteus]